MCSVPWLSIPRSDKQQHWFEWLLLQIFHHPKTPTTTMALRFACLSILRQREAPFTCQVHVCRESINELFFVKQSLQINSVRYHCCSSHVYAQTRTGLYSNELLNYTAVHHQHKTATALSPGSLGRSVGAGSLCRIFGAKL